MAESLTYTNLANHGWREFEFEPFKPGVEIYRLSQGKPEAALLRYAPGATIPRHRHTGLETILILEGSQCDEKGRYELGTFILNPAGTEHTVWTEEGCVVLIQWETPVAFLSIPSDTAEAD
ncbi:MAG: cupin domain-containing protein [Proteobacteria bacterium]|nr:cupin domain-containing protein [Pseudomonadota bacterium]